MIGIITSTSIISSPNQWPKEYLTSQETRIEQTQKTIESLKNAGIEKIFLLDNSGSEHAQFLAESYRGVELMVQSQYTFANKGISEIHMILNALRYISSDLPICKISGRYELYDYDAFASNKAYLDSHDLVLLKGNRGISTRSYMIKSKALLEKMLVAALNRCYHRQYMVSGWNSLMKLLKRKIEHDYQDTPFLSIEGAIYEVLNRIQMDYIFINRLGIRGQLALDSNTIIDE